MAIKVKAKKKCWVNSAFMNPGDVSFWPEEKPLPDYLEVATEADSVAIVGDDELADSPELIAQRERNEALESDIAELREINTGLESENKEFGEKISVMEAQIAELNEKLNVSEATRGDLEKQLAAKTAKKK